MKTASIKEEIHDYIEEADEHFLQMIYAIIQADSKRTLLTKEEEKELSQRVRKHKKGKSKSYSWSEAKKQIRTNAVRS